MKIAVLGVNGFLGRQLFLFFEQRGEEVMGWGRARPNFIPETQFHLLDVSSTDFGLLVEQQLIINCVGAGVQSNSQATNEELYEVNLHFPIRLITHLKDAGFKGQLITLGTYFEIGNDPLKHAYSEDELLRAAHPISNHYCASKRLLSRFIQSWRPDFCHFHLFLPTIYGPGEPDHRLLPYLINCTKKIQLPKLTGGTQVRQYLHVQNFCAILWTLANSNSKERLFLNLPSELTCTVRQLAERVYSFFEMSMPDSAFGIQTARDVDMPYLMLSDVRYQSLGFSLPVDRLKESLPNY